jgi:hypothetical protein
MNHVFMDFENVHQVDLTLIGAKSVSFTLMVGPQQTKLDSNLVEKLMEHSASVRLVKLKSKANNALDFALAYYLGRAALANPTACLHIIAKDGGYDPLIEHLRARHINVQRHKSCAELTFTWPGKKAVVSEAIVEKTAPKKMAKKIVTKKLLAVKTVKETSPDAGYLRVWDNFQKTPQSLPARRKTLLAKIGQLIGEKADGEKVAEIVKRLENAGMLTFDDKNHPKYSF